MSLKRISSAASTEAAASATRNCTVANSAMRRLPPASAPRVLRPVVESIKASSAPLAAPIAVEASIEAPTIKSGSR